jgi:hypothetical protein
MEKILIALMGSLVICGGVVSILTGNILANHFEDLVKYITGRDMPIESDPDPKNLRIKSVIKTIGMLLLIIGIATAIYGLILVVGGIASAGRIPLKY